MRKPRPPIVVTPKMRKRFARFIRVSDDGCWLWTGNRMAKGYGLFAVEGINHRAHRVSYEMATGQHPGSLFVCHHCDNPSCVNPAHLFLGTAQDNTNDMLAKGRRKAAKPCPHPASEKVPEKRGGKRCRACDRARWHRRKADYYAKRKLRQSNKGAVQ